jgi:hypothetical protein
MGDYAAGAINFMSGVNFIATEQDLAVVSGERGCKAEDYHAFYSPNMRFQRFA